MKKIDVCIEREERERLFDTRLTNKVGLVKELYKNENFSLWLAIDMFPYVVLVDNESKEEFHLGIKAYDRFRDDKNLLKYWTLHSWVCTIAEYLNSNELRGDLKTCKKKYNVSIKIWL